MKEFEYIIKAKNGLHARPAGKLASVSRGFESEILVGLGNKMADGKRILSVMSLGAKCGEVLNFKISGVDEEKAMIELKSCCESEL